MTDAQVGDTSTMARELLATFWVAIVKIVEDTV